MRNRWSLFPCSGVRSLEVLMLSAYAHVCSSIDADRLGVSPVCCAAYSAEVAQAEPTSSL
eukprot:6202822-Pleurochrysis_carterae.AAC.1